MALYRRKDAGIWYADFYVDGQRVQESTGTANKREAEKFLALRSSEVQRGVYVKPIHVPLPELWERYIAYARTHKRSWKRDEQMYGNLKAFLGTANLDTITALRVEEYQQHRVREVSPATVNRETALLKHMFNMAERWGQLSGRESRAVGEIPAGKQSAIRDDERGRRRRRFARLAALSPGPDRVRDQYRPQNERYFQSEMGRRWISSNDD